MDLARDHGDPATFRAYLKFTFHWITGCGFHLAVRAESQCGTASGIYGDFVNSPGVGELRGAA